MYRLFKYIEEEFYINNNNRSNVFKADFDFKPHLPTLIPSSPING